MASQFFKGFVFNEKTFIRAKGCPIIAVSKDGTIRMNIAQEAKIAKFARINERVKNFKKSRKVNV